MDVWNPQTFDDALCEKLSDHSELITAYHQEAQFLMDKHLNSKPYESLQPNKYAMEFQRLHELAITPLVKECRIRVWHYTRLLDDEAQAMMEKLEPSSFESLRKRLDGLVQKQLLTEEEADAVYGDSPFHEQEDTRGNRLWSVLVPIIPEDPGVEPLLESWGGESVYFWLKDGTLIQKLKKIGLPRIVEIETALHDGLNAYCAAKPVLEAWAKRCGVSVSPSNCDMAIKECIGDAKTLRIHTEGETSFETIAEGCS